MLLGRFSFRDVKGKMNPPGGRTLDIPEFPPSTSLARREAEYGSWVFPSPYVLYGGNRKTGFLCRKDRPLPSPAGGGALKKADQVAGRSEIGSCHLSCFSFEEPEKAREEREMAP